MRRAILALVAASVLTGAAAPARAQGAPPPSAPASAPVSASVSGNLVLYTSQLEADAAATVEAFRRRHPGVTVDWLRGGTGQILPRLRAEIAAGGPRADLLLLADALTFEALGAEGRLRASPEVDTGAVPNDRIDPQRRYFGTKLITTGIVHSTRAPFVPERWADLLRPEARNLSAMPSPTVSGAAVIHLQALEQAPGLGWNFVEQLVRAGVQPRGGNGQVIQAVATGERAFGIAVDYLSIREQRRGAPVRFVFPADGVSAITEPVAILESTRNAPAAVAFVSFLLSREGQALAAGQGFLPADPTVEPPAGFPNPSAVRILPLDAARAAAEGGETLRRFNALVGN